MAKWREIWLVGGMHVHTLVVGAGSSGCVVAARLSEDPSHRVLLVDAGPDYPTGDIPHDLADGTRNSIKAHDWGLKHTPSTTVLRLPLPRGRVVGGSSAVNTCIAIRALPRDIQEWADLGLHEWTWEACLPAFRAIETDLALGASRPDIHGADGPLPLFRHPPEAWTPWSAAFVEAAGDLGFAPCADTNDPTTPEGVGAHAMNQIDGRRISAAEAWLTPEVRQRASLTIWAHTQVSQLQFSGCRVVGAKVIRQGESQVVSADRVVLAAGAIHTPPLLLRSGIGARADLDRLGIDARIVLPGVAHRLLDHPGFAMFYRPRLKGMVDPASPVIQTVLRSSSGEGPWPHDLQFQAGSHVPIGRRTVPGVSLMAMLGKTRGHGQIRWPSVALDAKPVVRSRFHEHPEDRLRAVIAMELIRELGRQKELSALGTHIWPSARMVSTRAGIERWMPYVTDSGYHPSGTAPMGADDDPLAVTDGHGQVRGTAGLTIADASLLPTIPTGNIHLTVLMVAHRIAGWLARDADV
ncbi:MAG: choline dehydrogenase [Deltaproteobacteria bacterium]|nr:choline dehydrogenase [Deltaproteobacteria bacterium]HCH64287.1 choline dehydrogenase [Deltaproteobacteria bacterium]